MIDRVEYSQLSWSRYSNLHNEVSCNYRVSKQPDVVYQRSIFRTNYRKRRSL